MITYDFDLTPEEYLELRKIVGWKLFPLEQAAASLRNAFFVCCVRDNGKAIGCVRLLWDGGYISYLSDVIVIPEYQEQGIGRQLVTMALDHLKKAMKPGYKVKVNLMAAPGKEGFYKKFGFRERPNEDAGHGMDIWFED